MTDLFNTTPKKQQLSSRQREVLRILNEGGKAIPYKQKDIKKARRYRVEDKDGITVISSLKRMVIDNLYKMGRIIREEVDGNISYTKFIPQSIAFNPLVGSIEVKCNSDLDYFLSGSDANANKKIVMSVSEYELRNKLKIVRQQLNG